MGSNYAKGCESSFCGDDNILKLMVVMVNIPVSVLKAIELLYTFNEKFKWVNHMTCDLYLHKAVRKIRGKYMWQGNANLKPKVLF